MIHNPMAVLREIFNTFDLETAVHREILYDAAVAEINLRRGGCDCERIAKGHINTRVDVKGFHGHTGDMWQVTKVTDAETFSGVGKSVSDATRNMTDAA